MDWTLAIVVGIVFVAFLALKRALLAPAAVVRKHLAQGALVIDVRSPEEFRDGHVYIARNIPLDELAGRIQREVPDKSRALLLHCLSGGRSAIAKRQLRNMGYANAFNLGSLSRARRLVSGTSA